MQSAEDDITLEHLTSSAKRRTSAEEMREGISFTNTRNRRGPNILP